MPLFFSDFYEQDFQIKNLFVMLQTFWTPGGEFRMKKPRPTDALLYFEEAAALCFPKGGAPFSVPKGSLVYMAQGAEYRWQMLNENPARPITWLFEFTLTDDHGTPLRLGEGVQILEPEKPELCRLLFEGLLREAMRPRPFPAALKGQAYALLAEVIKTHHRQSLALAEGIREGIRYLENDIAQEKSIDEIASMCHMSLSSFEKQFKAYSGLSPRDYRLERRLERAEILLRNTAMPIRRIAEELGFYDAAAFCKLFKKKKGLPPSSLRR